MLSEVRGGPTSEIFLQRFTQEQIILAGDAANRIFYRASFPCRVLGIFERHSVVGGAAATAIVKKVTGSQAPGAGTDMMSAAFDLTATVNVEQNGALAAAATLRLAPGDCLGITLAGTLTGLVGIVTVLLQRIDS
jgi:hypothetical protein